MNDRVLDELTRALGADALRIGADVPERHAQDWSGLPPVAPKALLLPRNTDQVAQALRICHAHGQAVTPQGGLTGLSGGARPSPDAIAITLDRMSGVEEIDIATASATVLAGTPLEIVQRAADEAGFYFALDIGARGSCTIGGNLSTNAGGNRVLRYGMARDLVLGLEAVLADGTVLTSLNKMLKNNTGTDLKHLFVGTEGTLGIITRAVLKLHPKPLSVANALVRCTDYPAIVRLLRAGQAALAGTLSSFEVMWPDYYETMTARLPELRRPLAAAPGIYVLLEATGANPDTDPTRFEGFLESMLEAGTITDAVIAKSDKEGRELWALRDAVAEYGRVLGKFTSIDISFPIGAIGDAADAIRARLVAQWPDIIALRYGHIGDSNLHIVTNVPSLKDQPDAAVSAAVYDIVRAHHGSVSAEHGIGTIKRAYLGYSRTAAEIALMKTLKRAMDPKNILNPGKVFESV